MKLLKNLLLLGSIVSPVVVATPFENDPQQFYVEGQQLNQTIEDLNFLLCIASAARADAFVNKGAYSATLYEDDCEGTSDASADAAAATPTSSASSTTAASASGVTASGKTGLPAIVRVTRTDTASPVQAVAWVPIETDDDEGGDYDEGGDFDDGTDGSKGDDGGDGSKEDEEGSGGATIFMAINQNAGPSATAPNGDFTLRFDEYVEGYGVYGSAYLEASANSLKYRADAGQEEISSIKKANGDTVGIYSARGCANCSGENFEVAAYYQYYISVADKAFCQKLLSATREDFNSETNQYEWTDFTDAINSLDDIDLQKGETCYSTDITKAQRNVHRYGVYTDDGERLPITNSAFPLYADVVDSNGETQRVHAWADFWGVWLEPTGRALIDESTEFTRETYDDTTTTSGPETYNLTSTDIRIEKRDTSYIALNDLDGLSVVMYVRDDWWLAEFTNLFGTLAHDEYEGVFEKDGAEDGSGQFTFTTGVSFSNGYETTVLDTPITFTLAEWQTTMAKEEGAETDDWYYKYVRQMGVWSHDTRQWYDISAEALAAPASATAAAGVRTETTSIVSASDITETLYCIRDCIDGAAVQQTFTESVADGASTVSSPFADVGSHLKEDVTVTQVFNQQFQSMAEATDQFWLTDNAIQATGFKLGENGAAVTDFINGEADAKSFMRLEYGGMQQTTDSNTGDVVNVALYGQNGAFSVNNLNKLMAADVTDPGLVPVFNLDIKSIPAAGVSGSMDITVAVNSNGNLGWFEGDTSIAAKTTVDYASDGEEFVITIPSGATVGLSYMSPDGVEIEADYVTTSEQVFGYAGGDQDLGSVAGQSGISWNVFQLFSGHNGLANFTSAGIASFFNTNMDSNPYSRYAAIVKIDSSLALEGPAPDGDVSANIIGFFFYVAADDYLASTQVYEQGQHFQGMLASEAYAYTVQSGKVLDANGVELTKGSVASSAFAEMDDPNQLLQNVSYVSNEGWKSSLAWGIRTGQLVGESDLAKLECRKTGLAEEYEWHPVLGRDASELRLCESRLWDGGIATTYTISLEATPSYTIASATTGEQVVISEPKTLYYTVPETLNSDGTAVYGKDAGKRLRLEFRGHGDLGGIPGFVFDTATGEDLGEFVTEWKESYRYLSRFMLPDGAPLEDGLDSTVSYKVKALDGEEWLTPADGSVDGVADVSGKYADLYTMGVADLLPSSVDEVVLSIPDSPDYIGAIPAASELINDGNASVVHGEVVFTP